MAYLDVSAGMGEGKPWPVHASAAPVPPRNAQGTVTVERWRLLSWSWVDGNGAAALEFLERSRDVANENVAAVDAGSSLHR